MVDDVPLGPYIYARGKYILMVWGVSSSKVINNFSEVKKLHVECQRGVKFESAKSFCECSPILKNAHCLSVCQSFPF
jgi:hypothetical protein